MAGAAAGAFLAQRALASEQELESIAEIRRRLAPELKQLASEGCDYPHTTGDVFLVRVLRGNDGDVEKAEKWYRRCLEARREHGLDRIYQVVRGLPFNISKLPGSDVVGKHLVSISDESAMRTPQGDIIQCDYTGNIKWGQFFQEVGLDRYFTWQLHVHETKLVALDRLSRECGHIVKFVALVDMRDMQLPPKDFIDMEKKIKTHVFEVTGIEIVHRILFLSVPRFFHTLYRMVRPLLPARTSGNIRLLGRDFAEHPEALAEVDAPLLAKIVATRCAGATDEESSLVGTGQIVLAGSSFERAVPVTAGQIVSWTFRVGGREDLAAAGARGHLGGVMDVFHDATDVFFEATALWEPAEGEIAGPEDDSDLFTAVVAPKKVCPSDGDIEGSFVAERSGTILLQWKNFHSWVRAKVLADFRVHVDGGQ